ncbi:MAG: thiamine biosynthesis protein ThiS [Sphingobacterium sp.]|jgi:sulfur carrier protein|uniref:sulfur carrier protein ThiS n=1 Tax=unclassified Sphingobacterium TaxID=2609468 RepID=UPI0009852BBB|nr:sulfur carrier protein ThiS [Sphingobacterium sp. CZ-UAM]MDF2517077.1 thiamine biosynthesis protein ThiS [Sphingobacterium sp.]OOG19867.1 thiamine biosynthesis protein ThiS [Sphingobacterium sp. CZ-UAM]
MELTINHQIRFFDPAPNSLADLLQVELSGKTQGVAVAVNNQVIPKDDWPNTSLRASDQILLITATQGG